MLVIHKEVELLLQHKMTPIGWFATITSIIIGAILGYYIFKRFPNFFNFLNKDNKKIKEVINNPHLLAEKLKANGKIYEEGENGKRAEIDIKVGIDKEGNEVLNVDKIESNIKQTKKKVEDKPKKKVKKKTKKKVKKK